MPILDSRGNPVAHSHTRVASLDRGFWRQSSSTHNYIANVEKKPYKYHVWVYRCVQAICMNVGRLDPVLYEESRPEYETTDHDIIRRLHHPNNLMNYHQFRQYIVQMLLLPSAVGDGGECYLLAWNGSKDAPAELDKGEIPTEIMPVSEQYIEAKTEVDAQTNSRRLVGWYYGERNKTKESRREIPLGSVVRIYFPSPYDFLNGVSPMMAVELALNTDAKSEVYNARVFENDGAVAGVLTTDEVLDPDTKADNMREWMSTVGGLNRQRNIALLDGGLQYKQFALSMKDMEWKAQKEWSRDSIVAAFGLNKIAIGQYEALNYATIREGRKLLWYDTYMPIDKMICDAINSAWISNVDGGKYRIKSDYSRVESLRADMAEKAKMVVEFVNSGAPFELACRLSGVALNSEDLGRWPELGEVKKPVPPFAPVAESAPKVRTVRVDVSAREEIADVYAKSVLIPQERSFNTKLMRHFVRQRNLVLDNVDKWYNTVKSVACLPVSVRAPENTPQNIEMLLFDLNEEIDRLMRIYRPSAIGAAKAEVDQIGRELGAGISFSVSNEQIDIWLGERVELMKNIETATFEHAHEAIGEAVREAFDEGLTVKELQQRIKENVRDVYRVRLGEAPEPHGKFDLGGMSSSMTIARTEMGIITAETRFDAFQEEGIEKWEWVAAKDDKVRDAHNMRDGASVRVGDPFPYSVDGLPVRYPRDPIGSLGDIINCRCVAVAADD